MKPAGICQVLRLDETDSTQKVARMLAEQGAPHGTLVRADRQTAGKGRLERRWASPAGGLYLSLVLRPSFPPSRLAELSLATAKAIAGAIAELTGLRVAVKPPNDVYADSKKGPRKICGILAEASGGERALDWVVLGIGINVNNPTRGLPQAASLKTLTGKTWPLDRVLEAVLGQFDSVYEKRFG